MNKIVEQHEWLAMKEAANYMDVSYRYILHMVSNMAIPPAFIKKSSGKFYEIRKDWAQTYMPRNLKDSKIYLVEENNGSI